MTLNFFLGALKYEEFQYLFGKCIVNNDPKCIEGAINGVKESGYSSVSVIIFVLRVLYFSKFKYEKILEIIFKKLNEYSRILKGNCKKIIKMYSKVFMWSSKINEKLIDLAINKSDETLSPEFLNKIMTEANNQLLELKVYVNADEKQEIAHTNESGKKWDKYGKEWEEYLKKQRETQKQYDYFGEGKKINKDLVKIQENIIKLLKEASGQQSELSKSSEQKKPLKEDLKKPEDKLTTTTVYTETEQKKESAKMPIVEKVDFSHTTKGYSYEHEGESDTVN